MDFFDFGDNFGGGRHHRHEDVPDDYDDNRRHHRHDRDYDVED